MHGILESEIRELKSEGRSKSEWAASWGGVAAGMAASALFAAGCMIAPPPRVPGTLVFPTDRSLGEIRVGPAGAAEAEVGDDWRFGGREEWRTFAPARGSIRVPPVLEARLFVASEALADLSPLSRLAPDALEGVVVTVERNDVDTYDGRWLKDIGRLRGLRSLVIRARIRSESLAGIAGLQSLEHLDLSSADIDGRAFDTLGRLRNLRRLQVRLGTTILPEAWSCLTNLTAVRELSLYGPQTCEFATVAIAKLPALKRLLLRQGIVWTADGIRPLATHPAIEELSLYDVTSSAMLAEVARMPRLRSLRVRIDEEISLAPLAGAAHLESLSIGGTLCDRAMAGLEGCRCLRSFGGGADFQMFWPGLTDRGLEVLGRMPTLERVALGDGEFTDAGLEHLSALRRLRVLRLPNCSKFTDAGLAAIAACADLEEVDFHGDHFTDAGLERLASLPRLRSLNLMTAFRVTDVGVAAIGRARGLRELEVFAPKTTMGGLNALAVLRGLVHLRFVGARPEGAALDLSPLRALKEVEIGNARPGDTGWLAGLTQVDSMRVGLAEPIGDAAFERLARIPSLRILRFHPRARAAISDAVRERVARERPDLEIVIFN